MRPFWRGFWCELGLASAAIGLPTLIMAPPGVPRWLAVLLTAAMGYALTRVYGWELDRKLDERCRR